MYYFGKMTSSHQEVVLGRQRSRRRRRRLSNQRIVMAQPQALQQYPARVVYQPVLYNPIGNALPSTLPPVNLPPAQAIQVPQQPVPIVPPFAPYQARTSQQNAWAETPSGHPSHSEFALSPEQPTWLQRFCRAIRIPVGRASTITSTSVSGTPIHSRLRSPVGQPRTRRSSSRSPSMRPQNSPQPQIERDCTVSPVTVLQNHQARETTQSDSDGEQSSRASRTDVATVHSDDFEMPPRAAPDQVEEEHARPPQNATRSYDNKNTNSEGSSVSRPASTNYLPSVSSFRSG
ncbi:hypothetical protein B0T10DRAFT_475755 [Thelonectria olida]|uniref:Uncharacterized protein n=1 Tax=Thelonectria olida TaxID=1576542 RepID=A0A9P8WES2_9HYPO|nr:hypothetical protein B0T10DRAFT_475755 [Thelonectria olida]